MALNNFIFIFSLYILYLSVFLPEKCDGYNNWEEYWQAYEQTYYFPRLYPYKHEFNDDAYVIGTGFDAKINYVIPYFGRRFTGAYVSVDGNVELFKDTTPSPSYKPKVKWPNVDYPHDPDPPLLCAYYSSWALYSPNDPGSIHWRVLDPRTDATDITEGMLDILSQEVRQHVVGGDRFHATHGLIVTWDAMYFIGCAVEPNCPRNTVQLALVTDEVHTYAVYNYYNLTWVGSSRQTCNPNTGTREPSFDGCFPAQAGFNVGDGRHFEALPFSNEHTVVDLDQKSITGVQGRFIYGLSGLVPSRGGCTNDTEIEPALWPLEVYPKYVSMYGGTEVYFSGICVHADSDIKCRFGDREVDGTAVPNSQTKGMCISPMMDTVGWVDFCVSMDGGNNFGYCSEIHIVPKYYMWPEIHLYNSHGEWYSREHSTLMLKWNPDTLYYFHEDYQGDGSNYNDTEPNDLLVDINLLGYTEEPNANGTMQGAWHLLHIFEIGMENIGEYSFNTGEHECTADCGHEHPTCIFGCDFKKPIAGVIQVVVSSEDGGPTKSIYSEAVPLGWFMNTEMTRIHGDEWSDYVCIDWHNREEMDTSWMNEIDPCPLTRSQAYTDIGHFIYPEVPCEPESPCPMTPRPDPHIECAHSVASSSNRYGSVSTCCYHNDGHGSLIYGYDNPMGSSATRASPYIHRDHYDVKVTPYMSHWIRDRVPYIMCCNWTNNEQICMEQYMQVRPTLTQGEYKSSKYAASYGDPHFFTFDGTEFMFNGHGEFWLLKIKEPLEAIYDNFNLQGRFLQPPVKPVPGEINATVMSAVAMQEGQSIDMTVPKIEVQLNDADAPVKLLILVNGAVKDFTSPGLMYQEFFSTDKNRRTIIQNNDPVNDNKQGNFTIIFENRVAVQVANKEGFLHMVVSVPSIYFGNTRGLFGLWNDDPNDDLITPGDQVIASSESTEYIHSNFGLTWEIDEMDSRFTYRGQANSDYFSDKSFVPNYEEPEGDVGNITDAEVQAFCGDNAVCRFDYKTCYSKEVANTTMFYQQWLYEIQNASESVVACPYMEVSRSYRIVDTHLAGGHLTFTGCWEGYTLLGITDYDCIQINEYEAEWGPYMDTECKSDEEIAKEKQQLAAAIATPICLAIVIAAVATGGFIYYRKKKKPKAPSEHTDTGFSSPVRTDRNQQFENLAESASRSQSLASTNVSFGSIVLTEQIQAARPPRPQSQHKPNWQDQQPTHPTYVNASHTSLQGSQQDVRVQPYPNGTRGSQQDIRVQPYPNGTRGSQQDVRVQPYPNGTRGSQNDLARLQNNVSRGSQNSLAGSQGYPSNSGSRNDLTRVHGYAAHPSSHNPGNASFDNHNRSRGSQHSLNQMPGYSLPPNTSGQVNRSFDHKEQPLNNSRSYTEPRPLQNVHPPTDGRGGQSNIAMAEEESDSSFEPSPGNMVNNSQDQSAEFSKNTFV